MSIANAYMKSYVAKHIKKAGAVAISNIRKGMEESELMDDEFKFIFVYSPWALYYAQVTQPVSIPNFSMQLDLQPL